MLLPLDWRDWDSAKLDAVLAHERSHIRRRDPAVQFFSAIHRALLWASPLSWFFDRSIVRTAEQISDDDAIAATATASVTPRSCWNSCGAAPAKPIALGVPMARYDRPEKRIRRILNSTAISRGVTRRGIAAILLLTAPLAPCRDPRSTRGRSRCSGLDLSASNRGGPTRNPAPPAGPACTTGTAGCEIRGRQHQARRSQRSGTVSESGCIPEEE